MNEINPSNKRNFRPKRGLGSAITRQRRKAAEGAKANEDARKAAARAAARAEIERAQEAWKNRNQTVVPRFHDSIMNAVIRGQSAVARSYGLKQPVFATVTNTQTVKAWTDFQSIRIEYPLHKMPKPGSPHRDMLDTVAKIKGIFHHELGHIRFSTPFTDILNSIPAAEQSTIDKGTLHHVWNCLEDQRMEMAVVRSVKRISNYFIPMVIDVILGADERKSFTLDPQVLRDEQAQRALKSWVLLAGRQYLPEAVRRMSYESFNQYCTANGVQNGAAKWGVIVRKYLAAKTNKDLYATVVEAAKFLNECNSGNPMDGVDDHSRMGRRSDKPEDGSTNSGDDSEGWGDDDGDGDGDGDGEGEESDKDAQGKSTRKEDYKDRANKPKDKKENKAPTSNKWTGGQSNHGGDNHVFTPEEFLRTLEEAASTAQDIVAREGDVKNMAAQSYEIADKDGLKEYHGSGQMMDGSAQMEAASISVGIQQALESFVTASSPVWHTHVDHGVIDALAYRTKEVGSQDFHRFLEDHGNTGLDLHLTVMADVSGSMGSLMRQLSIFMYASGLACESLGIGHTFTLWSSGSENYRIWESGLVPEIFPTMGGTDPTEALDDLETHNREGMGSHLVLVFTDGEWANNFPSLARWSAEGRTIVFIRYGAGAKVCPDMGADRHILINSLVELPDYLTQSLIDVLGTNATNDGWS